VNAATVQHEASIFDRLFVAPEIAQVLLAVRFAPKDEDRMRELMEKYNQGTISADETAEMEAFRQIGSFLAIVHAKARLQLAQGNGNQPSAA
jgi:hypothetical protein